MAKVPAAKLYNHYYIDRKFERLNLFRQLHERYGGESVLYPGSFVHVTPSFVYPTAVYVDNHKEAAAFFANPANYAFIEKRKHYKGETTIRFHGIDFQTGIDEPDESFDLLVSLFTGFVTRHCKRYLKRGGLLLVNDSQGDASLASIDPDFQLIAVGSQTDGKYTLTDAYLDTYFVARADGTILTPEWVDKHLRGFKFRRMADVYLFRRVS